MSRSRARRKTFLLTTTSLSVGSLLAFSCGGHVDGTTSSAHNDGGIGTAGGGPFPGTGGLTGNPKGPWYDTGGYGGLAGAGGAGGAINSGGYGGLVGNPKAPWYDTGGYGGVAGAGGAGAGGTGGGPTDAGPDNWVTTANPKGSWYDDGGYDAPPDAPGPVDAGPGNSVDAGQGYPADAVAPNETPED